MTAPIPSDAWDAARWPEIAPIAFPAIWDTAKRINSHVETMIAVRMTGYPADWSDEDKREMAERHLFGRPDEPDTEAREVRS